MVKSQLITQIINRYKQLSEKDVELGISQIINCLSESLSRKERIEIRGFGSFDLHYRPSRTAHNPKTGEKVVTVPKYSPHFKPGKELRERINSSRGLPIEKETDEEVKDE